jgi:outer membrane receptor protein involved in Fe transport
VVLLLHKSKFRHAGVNAAVVAALLSILAPVRAAGETMGRRVSEVLSELRTQGLVFIYNTQMVNDELRVAREPQATSGIELAREILGQHGLALLAVAPNTFSVVKQTPASASAHATPTAATMLAEVVVHTSRYAVTNDATGSYTMFTQEEVNNLPRLGDETLSAVKRLPGAASNGFSSIGPMRGGVPNETGVLLDGMRLYEPFHLKNFLSPVSLLDTRLIDSMEVYSGGFSARYGDRMSSMIDAKSVRPNAPRYFELGLSVFHLNGLASAEFADGDAHALISARRSNLPALARVSENDFGEPSYSDGYGRLDYAFNAATRIAMNVLLSRDEITAIQDDGLQTAQAEYRNNYIWATLAHDWSDRATSELLAGFTDVTNDRYGQVNYPGQRTGTVTDLRTFHVASARIDTDIRGDVNAWSLQQRFGIEARSLSAQYRYASDILFAQDFPFPGSPPVLTQRTVAPQPASDEFAAYWDGRVEFSSQWAVQGGLRVDNQKENGLAYSEETHATQWSPRLSVLFAPTPETKLRASWGRYFQAQGINELQVEDGVDYFYPAQRADHSILSIEQSLGAGYDLRIEAYRKQYDRPQPRYENLFDPVVLLPEVEFDRVRIAPSSARADGVELLLTARPQSAWSGWFGYTWSRVEDRLADAGVRDVPRSWDQTHAFNVGIAWTRGPWVATLTDLYHTGWPTTEVVLSPQVSIGARNAARFSAYNSLDLRVTRTFSLTRGELDVFVEVTNATARKNPCCTEYSVQSVDGSTILVGETDYWLGLVPSAGVLWRY